MKKTLAIFLTVAMMSFMLVACGDSAAAAKEAKTTGIYLSPAQLSYSNMRPQYNYYLTTFTQQELTLMDDNTFCLIVSSSCFSALELAESTNDAKGNERTNFIQDLRRMHLQAQRPGRGSGGCHPGQDYPGGQEL